MAADPALEPRSRLRRADEVLDRLDPATRFRVVRVVAERPAELGSVLAVDLGFTPRTLFNLLDDLEAAGPLLVERQGQVRRPTITDRGSRWVADYNQELLP